MSNRRKIIFIKVTLSPILDSMKTQIQKTHLVLTLTLTLGAASALAQNMNDLYKLSRFNGSKEVKNTIVITKPGTYDFKNVLHIWNGRNHDCDAGKENGPQILRIEASNVIIKNFAYVGDGKTHGSSGLGDPIHIASCGRGQGNTCGSNGPKNVTLDRIYGHACEDMITIGTPGTKNVAIQNSTLIPVPNRGKWDKTIQINFGTDHKILNNKFIGGLRCVRLKPNTSAQINGNSFSGCKYGVLMSTKDSDIAPMKDGPSTAFLGSNSGGPVRCKDGGSIGSSGKQVCK